MIINGKKIADIILNELKQKISSIEERKPGLAFILVGKNSASQTYVRMKEKACKEIGIFSYTTMFNENIREEDLIKEIQKFNRDNKIDGILVQLPLPKNISLQNVVESIDPKKDVDGFHPVNVGKMLLGYKDVLLPCTPNGIKILLEKSNIEVEGKHIVIVGRSNIVGKPLSAILMQNSPGCNATITVANSYTKNLKNITSQADILVVAIGQPQFFKKDMIKENAVVIDVGINRILDKNKRSKIVGDVDFDEVKKIASHISPVPGGVGPMTIALLMKNTWKSFLLNKEKI